ncbi:hypothetical protein M1523_04075 [Patescibacteria group bacterium]|nr:hypothetical protein [Patescibacteria group bacterium]MCL5091869.1 hypothetical protein [Patescibacteria group bacterium]
MIKIFGIEINLGSKDDVTTLITVAVFIVIAGLFFFSLKGYLETSDQIMRSQSETSDLHNRVNNIDTNMKVVDPKQIDLYNRVLGMLIPDSEDYYSIINALETISLQSGFVITNYTIDAGALSQEKVTLKVEGVGDSQAFTEFLQSYQFGSGRLITNEKVEFVTAGLTSMKLSLNFYNQKYTSPQDSTMSHLTVHDRNNLMKIIQKIKVNLVASGQTFDDNALHYQTKDNPFN